MIRQMTLETMNYYKVRGDGFDVIGKIIPKFDGEQWNFSEVIYDRTYFKQYENDEIDRSYVENLNKAVFFYIENNRYIGQIKLYKSWNGYAFIEDISVTKEARNNGIGKQLIQQAIVWAKERDCIGLTLETQDVNVQACRFYAKNGFEIGAVDTKLYAYFDTKNEKAIFWYYLF